MSFVALKTILLEILYGCELYCSYCYVGTEKNHRNPTVASLPKLIEIIDRLKHEGIQEIVLLGGEPSLHPKLRDICHAIAERGFSARGIVTNGTSLTSEKVTLLKELGFWVDVSIRAPDKVTFESITKLNGSYDKFVKGMRLLAQHEMSIGLEYDPIQSNFDKLFDSVEFVRNLGVNVKQVQVHRLLPPRDTIANTQLIQLSQYEIVFRQVERITREFDIPAFFEDAFPLCLIEPEYWKYVVSCGCGRSLLTVDPKGDVRYCTASNRVLGNIYNSSLHDIWAGPLASFHDTKRQHPQCLECDIYSICQGGCSASGCTTNSHGLDAFSDMFHAQKLSATTMEKLPEARSLFGQQLMVRPR